MKARDRKRRTLDSEHYCPDCRGRPEEWTPREIRINRLMRKLSLSLWRKLHQRGMPGTLSEFRQWAEPQFMLLADDLLEVNWQDYDNLPWPLYFDEEARRLKWTLNETAGKQAFSVSR